ncbi:penicillin-binding transpeptidase domain-containing protein [Desulfoferula mesophila]|uniref:Penicillin-binding protein n=1 Tax=Desulfoferula mesophila TaxID=3058419 RepID=A0AAU9F496_9BACT|nr:penicillin-binding protein [Desulfoferula mesophilus]
MVRRLVVFGRLAPVAAFFLVLACLAGAAIPALAGPTTLDKTQLARMLGGGWTPRLAAGYTLELRHDRLGRMRLEPTIIPSLQAQADNLLKPLKSHRAAVVVLEPSSGKVLVLSGVRRGRLDPGVALDATAPAASLFKVVTAAAALEETGLDPDSRLGYVGRAHTLYRFQLKEKPRYRPQQVTLAKSFASSNNPIFARLGIYQVGGRILTNYAHSLGFEKKLPFELPLNSSCLVKPASSYGVGEMASGYNRVTSMSPLHAALVVSTFLNGGRLPEPYIVKRLSSADGMTYYLGKPHLGPPIISPETCDQMQRLFEATVEVGTARKAFRRLNRDKVLKNLELGGKTGTIRGPDRSELFEWFAGYGHDPESGHTLAVAVLVVHGKVRYANPKRLARRMLQEAFRSGTLYADKKPGAIH